MSERQVRLGIIGTGHIARGAHLPAFLGMEDVSVAAVLGSSREKSEAAAHTFGIHFAAGNLQELLRQDLDAVALLTPKTVRREYLEPLMEAKLDILVEKPLAMTLRECEAIADMAARSGQIVMVGFNRRFAPIYRQGIDSFGDVRPHLMLCSKSREFKEYRATLENAIHMLDLMRSVFGECRALDAQALWGDDPMHEDLCTAQLRFDGGIGVLCASRQAGQWYERVELLGGSRTVVMEPPGRLTVTLPDREEVYNAVTLQKGWLSYVEGLGYAGCDRHFIDCVKNRTTPVCSAEDALKTHILMDQVLKAAGLPDLTEEWESGR